VAIPDGVDDGIGLLEQLTAPLAQKVPGRGDFDSTSDPDDQVDAQLGLKLLDGGAQRRL
jgi:hypothetical protein